MQVNLCLVHQFRTKKAWIESRMHEVIEIDTFELKKIETLVFLYRFVL